MDRYHIGHTSEIYRRLNEHNNPVESSKYTGKGNPRNLILFFEISDSRSDTIQTLRFNKGQKGHSIIHILMDLIYEFFTLITKPPEC
jgi:predicted GIY-YIG superfamily endonuclease